ncbi:MAG TPA: polyprenyl diphosphate synthase [Nevskiales bacterium]|nr:polyprenyl diphosphate synthase [Nevskiales bacterium]
MPETAPLHLPRHLAVIMDGNGRWAQRRLLPRTAGHRAGVKSTRLLVENAARRGIGIVTVFAFSSENWNRPPDEVGMLMDLFLRSLRQEAAELHENRIRLRFIGDRSAFQPLLREEMARAEALTAANDRLDLIVAVGYGGRWDIVQAARGLVAQALRGELRAEHVTEQRFAAELSLAGLPEPDLLIRTGGEQRISNFLMWHFAYTELYFCETLWPDFDEAALDQALAWYASRQRRFGRVPAPDGD